MKETENLIIVKLAEDFSDAPGGTADRIKFYREL